MSHTYVQRCLMAVVIIGVLAVMPTGHPSHAGEDPGEAFIGLWEGLAQGGTGVQFLTGVNRAGAEFGEEWDGWTGQTYYEWPSATVRTNELNYYVSKGMNVVRLPISWERLQHTLNGPLDPTYQANLVAYVDAATSMGFAVIIDLHNYGRYATGAHNAAGVQVNTYTQHILGDGTLTFAHVADVWTQIATLFVSNPRVIFNLMNEQHDADESLDSTAIFAGYQTVLNAVRATGATQLILFPNTRSSDTHHWSTWSPQGGPLDSVVALSVMDSANNLAFDMHSYPPWDNWNDDITVVTDWARANGKRLFLSEFGTTSGATAVSTLLTYINSNADVWVGWTVWNLAPYSISVTNRSTGVVSDTPKMTWYAPYFAATPPTSSDSDGDGITDSIDECPTVKGVKTSDPSTNGCAPLIVTAVKTYDWGSGYCKQFYFENSNPMAMAWKSMMIYLSDGRLRGSGAVWGAVFPNPTATGTVVVTPVSYTSPVPAGKNVATVGFCADKGVSGYIGTNGSLAY